MQNSIVIIESPTKIPGWEKFSGMETIATKGHYRDLPANEFGIDLNTYEGKFIVQPNSTYVRNNLIKKCKGKDVYIATDGDREGDAIGFFVYKDVIKEAKNVYRVITGAIDKDSIDEAMDKKILFEEVDKNKFYAFFGRRLADRLVGYLLSPNR